MSACEWREMCAICGRWYATEVTRIETVHLHAVFVDYQYRCFQCLSCGYVYTNDEQGYANEAAELVAAREAARILLADERARAARWKRWAKSVWHLRAEAKRRLRQRKAEDQACAESEARFWAGMREETGGGSDV